MSLCTCQLYDLPPIPVRVNHCQMWVIQFMYIDVAYSHFFDLQFLENDPPSNPYMINRANWHTPESLWIWQWLTLDWTWWQGYRVCVIQLASALSRFKFLFIKKEQHPFIQMENLVIYHADNTLFSVYADITGTDWGRLLSPGVVFFISIGKNYQYVGLYIFLNWIPPHDISIIGQLFH